MGGRKAIVCVHFWSNQSMFGKGWVPLLTVQLPKKALLVPAMFSQPKDSKQPVNLRISLFILLRGRVELPAVTDVLTFSEPATKSALVSSCIFQEGGNPKPPPLLFSL